MQVPSEDKSGKNPKEVLWRGWRVSWEHNKAERLIKNMKLRNWSIPVWMLRYLTNCTCMIKSSSSQKLKDFSKIVQMAELRIRREVRRESNWRKSWVLYNPLRPSLPVSLSVNYWIFTTTQHDLVSWAAEASQCRTVLSEPFTWLHGGWPYGLLWRRVSRERVELGRKLREELNVNPHILWV